MKNEEIIEKWYDEVWNKKNEAAIDKMLASNCVAHGLVDENGDEIVGPTKFKVLFRKFVASFPDIRFKVLQTVNERNKIAALATASFTHAGSSFEAFPGKSIPASGKKVTISGITMTLIEDGRILEAWNSFDFLSMYAQLGAL